MRKVSWIIGLVLVAGAAYLIVMPPACGGVGSYSTSFVGRTGSQQANAVRAARALDDVVIPPGDTFSFNRTVGPWTADCGYVKAPVSFSGTLLPAWGGGVCQTSTALYNAALIAGLEIVERHRHLWPPTYVPPGRDAAVAQYDIDLRLRNPYPWLVRIDARTSGEKVGFTILGRAAGPMAEIITEDRDILAPREILQLDHESLPGERHILNPGRPGMRVSVYRVILKGNNVGQRELISQDSYRPMNRVLEVGA